MCVDDDSFPPIRPISGGAAGSRDFHLTSADGTKVMAHAARAAKPTGAGMVVIPDVRGLHPYYKELADRFAEIGVESTLPPNSSSTTLCCSRSCFTFCTLAEGRSILLIATIIGTPAFLA